MVQGKQKNSASITNGDATEINAKVDAKTKKPKPKPKKYPSQNKKPAMAPTEPPSDLPVGLELGSLLKRKDLKYEDCVNPDRVYYEHMPLPNHCMRFNLFYVKAPKVGSSTMGGIARRISARYGVHCTSCALPSAQRAREPRVIASHISTRDIQHIEDHNGLPNFQWGMFRDPRTRCLSEFYHFMVSRKAISPTDENIIDYAKSECRNRLWEYHGFASPGSRKHYDFIALTERYTESVLILAYMLGVSIGDILYLPSKVSKEAHQDNIKGHQKFVPNIPLSQHSEKVQEFFNGEEFRHRNFHDFSVFEVANKEIDKKIDEIGRARFERKLAEYEFYLHQVKIACPLYNATGAMLPGVECFWSDKWLWV